MALHHGAKRVAVDGHLPLEWRLAPHELWQLVDKLPTEAALARLDEDAAWEANGRLNRVLPQHGGMSIHNEEMEHETVLDVRAPAPARAAAFAALGWSEGRLPAKHELRQHILTRLELEYAEDIWLGGDSGDDDDGDSNFDMGSELDPDDGLDACFCSGDELCADAHELPGA